MPYYQMPPPADDIAQRGTKAWRQAVMARRNWAANELWTAQARQNLDLSNPEALSRHLGTLGITPEVGGGRHMYRMFMGDLPSEGFGMSSPQRGISYALEAYMPDWKRYHDRTIQGGNPRGVTENMYFPWSPWNAPQATPTATGLPASTASASAAPMPAAMMPEDEDEEDRMGMAAWGGY